MAITDNLAGIRDRVRRWLHEISQENSFWSDTFIDQMINTSYRRRCAQLAMAHEGYFTNVATRDIVAEQERYAWPPGFERLLKMEIVNSNGDRFSIQRYERHYEGKSGTSVNPDFGSFIYRSIAGGFVLEPTPNEDVTDGIRIEYYGLPTQMTADGDSMHADFPRSFDELVVLDAAVAVLDSENLLETGMPRSILRQRQEWELDFERYVDGRLLSQNRIVPFIPYDMDA